MRSGGSVPGSFNSLWELDGVRTCQNDWSPKGPLIKPIFQFPVGIRWCSDARIYEAAEAGNETFNSLWELDGVRTGGDKNDTKTNHLLSIPCGN